MGCQNSNSNPISSVQGGIETMRNESTVRETRLMDSRASGELEEAKPALSIKRILAPTDLTSEGREAIDYAVTLASRFAAELILLHVYEAKGSREYSLNVLDDTIVDDNRERAEDALRKLCTEISQAYPHCDMCFRSGIPNEEIVFAARDLDADLIVISAHNHHWYMHLIGRTDAEKIMRRATCPVMVVRFPITRTRALRS
jgi:universal stress protein A